ncbi:MAG: hypothetical protein HYW26_03610 [Candidatus Aenigmarchaeota archaeon]|nr:hypothetical protein [Candidatus Aenigmarchaeota archaeon]
MPPKPSRLSLGQLSELALSKGLEPIAFGAPNGQRYMLRRGEGRRWVLVALDVYPNDGGSFSARYLKKSSNPDIIYHGHFGPNGEYGKGAERIVREIKKLPVRS